MAIFYVRKTGSDANAGTSAGAAWLTVGKALGASGMASGDTVYVGAGVYREALTVALTNPTAETRVVADVDGAQTGDAGRVVLTAYTTNDKSAPGGTTLTLNGRNFLTFEGLYLVGGSSGVVSANSGTPHDLIFRRCVLVPGGSAGSLLNYVGAAGAAANWLFDTCAIIAAPQAAALAFVLPTHSADYDCAINIKNCWFSGPGTGVDTIGISTSGALTGLPGGFNVFSCTFFTCYRPVHANNNMSTTTTSAFKGNLVVGAQNAISANNASSWVDDYNLIHAITPRTNVTAGSNSISTYNYAELLDYGWAKINGFQYPPMFSPIAGSPILGFDPLAGGTGYTSPTAPTADLHNRPRPAGGASVVRAVGALELHDTAAKETGTVDAGGVGLKITGPGDHDLLVAVPASATTITIRARYDTNHGATNKPQVLLLANGEIGVAAQTLTMAAAVDTWETLTFSSFTPTAKGVVTLRLISRAAAGTGIAFFDTATVPDIDTGDFGNFRWGEPFPALAAQGTGAGGSGPTRILTPVSGGWQPVY